MRKLVLAWFMLAGVAHGEVHLCPPNLCNGSTVISHPQPPGTKVLIFKANATRAIYVSNESCKRELYSVAVVGGTVVKLSNLPDSVPHGGDPCFRNVTDEISISPDGAFAVWEADADINSHPADGDQDYQIYSTPILGGATMRLTAALPFDYDIERHAVTCDSKRVIFRRGKDSSDKWELWSAPIRVPSGGQRISQPEEFGKDVAQFWVRCDGTVLYERDDNASGAYVRYRWNVADGRIMREVFADGFNDGTTGGWR